MLLLSTLMFSSGPERYCRIQSLYFVVNEDLPPDLLPIHVSEWPFFFALGQISQPIERA